MPLSGSDKAYKQARSGIARAGATRSGFYQPINVVITINSVDRTSSVMIGSLSVSLALNDEPDSARFTLKPGATIPTYGQTVRIALGAAGNDIFAGQVGRVQHRRRKMPGTQQSPFVDVECIDWTLLFDRQVINTEYSSLSATTIATDIIARTSGFTSAHVAEGLPTIDYFPLTNEKPSTALRRLVNLMGGGGFYIDTDRDVHFFGPGGDTFVSSPQTLTNTTGTLLDFSHNYDYSQVRNRVICEGMRTKTLLACQAGATSLPVENLTALPSSGGTVRIGFERATYSFSRDPRDFEGSFDTSGTINAAVSPGDTSVTLATGGLDVLATGWVRAGDQVFVYLSHGGTPSAPTLDAIPVSGYGSIKAELAVGTEVIFLPFISGMALTLPHPIGTDVVMYVQADDAVSQAAIAAIEGGDGIHEVVISDGRLTIAGATARAQAELDSFKDPLTELVYETEDMSASPGAAQVVNLTTTDPLSTTLTITHADLSFPVKNYPPIRQCRASTVRLAEFPDLIPTESI